MSMFNDVLLIALPYTAVVVCIIGTILRIRSRGYQASTLSSQFLEGGKLFWGSVPFHWGMVVVFFAHLLAFLIPSSILWWNSVPVRLLALEITGFAFGLTVLVGLGALLLRRLTNPRIRAVTTPMDIVIELLLLGQVVLGLWIAIGYRWGSSWFASVVSPYLWSLLALSPNTAAAAALPFVVRLHIAGAFLLLLLVPFSRLVHFISLPVTFVIRPRQRVLWAWDRQTARDPDAPWNQHPPRNN